MKNEVIFDKNNYIFNLKTIKSILDTKKLCLVLKSNAYGIGIDKLINDVINLVDYIGILDNNAAHVIRKYSNKIKILRIRPAEFEEISQGLKYNIEEIIDSSEKLDLIFSSFKKIPVHLSIDSGMNNIGMKISHITMNKLNQLNLIGLMTHYPSIIDLKSSEYLEFNKLYFKLKEKYPKLIGHSCNSSNFIFHGNKIYYDMIRIGKLQYGMYRKTEFLLKPTISWQVKYLNIRTLKKGDSIGYSSLFIAKKDTKVLIIPYGYYNGYPLIENNQQFVLINKMKCPVIGKVSMNMIHIDITNVNQPINKIYLFGNGIFLEDINSNPYYHDGLILLNIAKNNKIIFNY